jgi:hypothetical protein
VTGRPLGALTRVLRTEPRAARADAGDRCEMCGTATAAQHSHVVDLDSREVLCTCRPCGLLFTQAGAGSGRYRAVPERYLAFPHASITDQQWDALGVPVGMAFFFTNSRLGRTVAFYPSPAGATESELDLAAWADVVAANPGLATVEPDVEAVLVRAGDARSGSGAPAGRECFVVPIDACYELVGHMRLLWQGFDGGREARERIEAFFADVRGRARPLRAAAETQGTLR